MDYTKSRILNFNVASATPESVYCRDSVIRVHTDQDGATQRVIESIDYDAAASFNRCQATKSTSFSQGTPAALAGHGIDQVVVRWGRPGLNGYPPSIVQQLSHGWILNPTRIKGTRALAPTEEQIYLAKYDSYTHMLHGAPGGHMNVTQSIMELKDTKETIKPLLDFVKFGRKFLGRGGLRGLGGKKFTLFTTLSSAANAYLWYKFGVEPTVHDVQQFRDELARGKLLVRRKGNPNSHGKPVKRCIKSYFNIGPKATEIEGAMFPNGEISAEESEVIELSSYGNVPAGYTSSVTIPLTHRFPSTRLPSGYKVGVTRYKGCVFAEYTESSQYDFDDDEVRRRWEFSCPGLATMWELLPFSFLVDWVVDVGGFIRRLERRYAQTTLSRWLGPAWVGVRRIEEVYEPGIERFSLNVSPVGTNPAGYDRSGPLNASWSYRMRPVLVSRNQTYLREPMREEPSWIWPTLTRAFRAYQISAGMALLLQSAEDWMGHK